MMLKTLPSDSAHHPGGDAGPVAAHDRSFRAAAALYGEEPPGGRQAEAGELQHRRACGGRTRQSLGHGTTRAKHGPQRRGRSGDMQGTADVHRVTACHNLPHTRPTERSEGGGDVVIPAESGHCNRAAKLTTLCSRSRRVFVAPSHTDAQ